MGARPGLQIPIHELLHKAGRAKGPRGRFGKLLPVCQEAFGRRSQKSFTTKAQCPPSKGEVRGWALGVAASRIVCSHLATLSVHGPQRAGQVSVACTQTMSRL